MSTCPNHSSCAANWLRPSSTPWAQILVATVASRRRGSRAAPSERSAAPYIGDESKSRAPTPNAASTTSPARRASPPNVFHVPRPTTGPSFLCSRGTSALGRIDPGPGGDVQQRERHPYHGFEVVDGNVLVRGVDVRHSVGEV